LQIVPKLMITHMCNSIQAYLVRMHDMSSHPKTGEKQFELVLSDIKYMRENVGV